MYICKFIFEASRWKVEGNAAVYLYLYISNPHIISKTRLSPINHHIRSRDIPPCPPTQHHHRARQLLRDPHPPPRTPTVPDLARGSEPGPSIQHSIHIPRRDGVNADAVAGPFGSEGGLEAHERGFGGIVRGLWLGEVGAVCGDGGDEEDRAAGLGGDERSSECLGAEEGARGVDFERARPLICCHVQRVRASDHAGKAAEDGHGAELRCGLSYCALDLCGVRDVAAY